MWRGIETILKGRDPRDAWVFTQRFCGVCTTVHAISSIRSVEHALELEVPLNAQLIRNLMIRPHSVQDHIVHFYHLSALDWVDVRLALKADPKKTAQLAESISELAGEHEHRIHGGAGQAQGLRRTGQLGIFPNGYWGHPAMQLPPEANLMAVAHYLKALDYPAQGATRPSPSSAARTRTCRTSRSAASPPPSTWRTPPPSTWSGSYGQGPDGRDQRALSSRSTIRTWPPSAALLHGLVQATAPASTTTWPCRTSRSTPR